MLTRFRSRWQRAIALAIAVSTFSPDSLALIHLFGSDGETCGMSCCRRMKSCCCRKAKRQAADVASSRWQAGPGCSEDCRQQVSLPPIVLGIAATARLKIQSPPAHIGSLPAFQVYAVPIRGGYAQCERPPPPNS